MKAAQLTHYNKKNIALTLTDVEKPKVSADHVVVKVTAAGVNPLDNMISRGEVTMITPYRLPLTAGNELVGIVESVGSQVHQFAPGDRVFARLPLDSIGAFAEYVRVHVSALAKVPDYLTDIEAAAIPLTALTIMQAFDLMNITAGNTIFISGGTGGVGAMAIPLAKARGLTVITNGNADNNERILALGADQFLDYKQEDYATTIKDVDYVLDTLGGDDTEKQMTIMKKGGHLVSLRGMPNGAFARRMKLPLWKQILFNVAGRKVDNLATRYGITYHFIFVEANGAQLQDVADLFTQLKITPSIDAVFPFENVNDALDKVANSRSRGKTVLSF